MKERPILFSGPMIRAILDGQKTQTRRVIKPDWWRCLDPEDEDDRQQALRTCPYGQPGDRLWVRETWNADWCDHIIYRADGGSAKDAGYGTEPKWKPSIFMPRWASRLTLEVVDVRVERLQEIDEDDAVAEGATRMADISRDSGWSMDWSQVGRPSRYAPNRILTPRCIALGSARMAFANYWNLLNEKRGFGWVVNPWVFVMEFEK
jgi:hypothetical protein